MSRRRERLEVEVVVVFRIYARDRSVLFGLPGAVPSSVLCGHPNFPRLGPRQTMPVVPPAEPRSPHPLLVLRRSSVNLWPYQSCRLGLRGKFMTLHEHSVQSIMYHAVT